jgi:hypothetical protein
MMVSDPIQETADFNAAFVVKIVGSGSVVASFYGSSYTVTGELTFYVPPGTNVTLTAKPGLLRSFEGWQGIPAGGASSVLITAGAPVAVTASFTINLVEALGVGVLWCGVAIYLIAYLVWNRPKFTKATLRGQKRRGTSSDQ